MRTTARSTRRTTPLVGKENLASYDPRPQRDTITGTLSNKKPRHRLTITELARLEHVFKQNTHPSRQQKKDLAAELSMDYKTITIWFQNKRQTSKRGQPPPVQESRSDTHPGQPRVDSGLRAVSSPSHNATLDASGDDLDDLEVVVAVEGVLEKPRGDGLNGIAARAIVKMKPLLDSLNALTSRPRGRSESVGTNDEAPNVGDVDLFRPQQALSESAIAPVEPSGRDHVAEQEQIKEKPSRWKRIRTLEWACERQAKRRKLSREAYIRLDSEEVEDHGGPDDTRVDSALSLLSLASSTKVEYPKDVMRGASLLLSFKHSWCRK